MKRFVSTVIFLTAVYWLFAQAFTDIRSAHNISYSGSSTQLSDGASVAVFVDTTHGSQDVYAQKFSASGDPVWPEPVPVALKSDPMQFPAITVTSDGGYFVAWVESQGMLTRVYAQKLDSLGVALWQTGGVQVFGDLGVKELGLVANSIGGAYILASSYSPEYWNNLWGANLDNSGQNLWQAGGQPVLSHSDRISFAKALSDGAGGVIIKAYKGIDYSSMQGHMFRLGSDGNYIGNNPLFSETGVNYNTFRIHRCLDGNYLLYNIVEPNSRIHFNKFDNLGNSLLPAPVEYAYNGEIGLFAESPDGSFYLGGYSWNSSNSYLRMQKFNANYVPVWTASTNQCLGTSTYLYGNPQVDSNGNCWFSWSSYYSSNTNQGVRIQKFDANGSPVFGENGLLLSASEAREQQSLHSVSTGMLALWTDKVDGNISFRRQLISFVGTFLLPAQGEVLASHLYGAAQLKANLSLPDGFMQVWNDYRYYPGGSIYYQKTSLQHTQLYEADGRLLVSEGAVLGACANSLGEVLVAYNSVENSWDNCYIQIIGVDGQPVYPNNGVLISMQAKGVNVSAQDADFYLAWLGETAVGADQIMGQRISNGQMMWEPEGRIIKAFPYTPIVSTISLQGRYFIWDEGYVKVLRLEPDGSPSPGWNPLGNNVAAGSSTQSIGKTGLIDGNLAIVVTDALIRAQLVSPQGTMLWGGGIQMISGVSGDRFYAKADIKNGISALFYFNNSATGVNTLYLQRINPAGELECDISGQYICSGDWLATSAEIIDHGTGELTIIAPAVTIAYENYRLYDLIRFNVTAGEEVGPGVAMGACVKHNFDLLAAKHPAETMLAWNQCNFHAEDSYSGYYSYTSVSGSYLGTQSSEVESDLAVPQAIISGLSNYPNPFSASTSVSFKLGKATTVELKIYNLKGQLVKSTVIPAANTNKTMQIAWDGTDNHDYSMPAGVYLYSVQSKEEKLTGKMLKLK